MEEEQEVQRERWRIKKRLQRARMKVQPRALEAEFVSKVLSEADLRERDVQRYGGWRRDLSRPEQKIIVSVWVAKTLLEKQLGEGKATPTRITKWLVENNRMHGYTAGSLRVLTYRMLDRIAALEATIDRRTGEPIWGAL